MTTEQSPLSEAELADLERGFDGDKRLESAIEILEAVNEWFGQREAGKPTTNGEEVMFREVFLRLEQLSHSHAEPSKLARLIAEVRRSRTGGTGEGDWREFTPFQVAKVPGSTVVEVETKDGRVYRHQPLSNFAFPNAGIVRWRPASAPLPEDGGAGGVAEPDETKAVPTAWIEYAGPVPIAAEPAGTPVVTEGMVRAAAMEIAMSWGEDHEEWRGYAEVARFALEAALAFSKGAQNG